MALFGRKSMRQFACNDALWATFERMAGDQEKNVDELLNDALESYAQLAGYQTGIDAESEPRAEAEDFEGPSTPQPAQTAHGRHHNQQASHTGHAGHAAPPPPPLPAATRFGRPIPAPKGGLGGMFQAGALRNLKEVMPPVIHQPRAKFNRWCRSGSIRHIYPYPV